MRNLREFMENWYISYDPYSDLFQIYDRVVYKSSRNSLIEKKDNFVRAVYDKNSSLPILFEIKDIYKKFGIDIDNMVKSDIIRKIEPYINKYV